MTELEKAYLAGVIDGEGTITLTKDGEFRYPTITFCNNDKGIIDYVNTFCLGTVSVKRSDNPLHKDNYVWKLAHRRAVDVIQEILPYMHESKKVARGKTIIENYIALTPRNGKYSAELKIKKHLWEEEFFKIN